MKVSFLSLSLLLAGSVLAAGINQLHRNAEGALVCNRGAGADDAEDLLSCLRLGKLYLGQPRTELEQLLGKANREMRVSGVDYYVYVIEPFYEVKDFFPYWVVSYEAGKVASLQATGLAVPPNIDLSGIHFGDTPEQVEGLIGVPSHRFRRRDNGLEVWDYRPLPLTIEFKDSKVYSIRVARR